MILESLLSCYERLLDCGLVPPMGWSNVGITYVLILSEEGRLIDISDVRTISDKGDVLPRKYVVPAPVQRTSKVKASFLSDNARYFLGLDWIDDSLSEEKKQDKRKRASECFSASAALHEKLLAHVDTPCSRALKGFFRMWNCDSADLNGYSVADHKLLLTTAKIIFRCPAGFIHEDPLIRNAWSEYHKSQLGATEDGICSVTGKKTSIELVHPLVKMRGALSTGAVLVSCNEPAFCSFGKVQGENASVGKYAAFAYTTALNYLLNSDSHTLFIGDMALVFWSEDCKPVYQDLFSLSLIKRDVNYKENDLFEMIRNIISGYSVDFEGSRIDPCMKFYVLGLTPNVSRIAVKLYCRNSFGVILKNVTEHHERLNIACNDWWKDTHLTIWNLMNETVNRKSKTEKPRADIACALVKAIITGADYPMVLFNSIMLRIKAEHDISYIKASMLKAFYMKNGNKLFDCPMEVLTVKLNLTCKDIPYNLGRLLAVLEKIQKDAMPGIRVNIKEKYWNSYCSTPASVLPLLLNLAQKHIRKLSVRKKVFYEKLVTEIMQNIDEEFPARLSLANQGKLMLGYYHQNQYIYTKKEDR